MTKNSLGDIDANLYSLVKSGDTTKLKKLLGKLYLDKNSSIATFMLTRLLGIASVTANCRVLREDFVKELIARIAPRCDIFYLLSLICLEAEIESVDHTLIPKHVRNAVRTHNLGITICGSSIERLGWTSFRAFLGYVLEEYSESLGLRPELNAPILRQVYRYNLVSDSMLLSLMGLSIHKADGIESIGTILGS